MEDRKEANRGAQVLGIGGYLQQGLGTGVEQKVIEELLVLQYQLGKLLRQSEDDMDIGDRQEFVLTSRDPAITSPILALGAMAITAAVVGDGLIATARAMVAMSTQGCGTATSNGLEHFAVSPVDPAAVVLDEAIVLCANDIGHLERWPSHFFSSLRECLN